MGTRFDKAIDPDTDYKVKLTSSLPYLGSSDSATAANELRTHLVVTGDAESGMGMFSFGNLLGSRMASPKLFTQVADADPNISSAAMAELQPIFQVRFEEKL